MKDINGITVSDADIYIGRKICNQSWDLPTSKWSNPFYVKNYIHDEKSLWDYEQYIRGSKLWDSLEELEGKTLGCWCWPSPCHGDILVKLLEEKAKNRIKSQLRGAGFELLSDSDLTGIRHARQWANHRIWLAYATRLDSTNIFYFTPHLYDSIKRTFGGYCPEYFEVRTDDDKRFYIVGEFFFVQPIGPFWVDTQRSKQVNILDPVLAFAKKIQPIIEANRHETNVALTKSISYLELHRAIVRRVADAIGRNMDDHDLTKTRIIQVALGYRWHWDGVQKNDILNSADLAIMAGHTKLEDHHPEYALSDRGEVDVDKLLIDRLSVHMQKDKFDNMNGWDVDLKWIPPAYHACWHNFKDKFGHIDLYSDAYHPARADITWAHEAPPRFPQRIQPVWGCGYGQ